MKILLVDDDADFRRTMGRLLSDRGYALSVAADGVQALASMEAGVPDLVISDLRMPGMDGIELLQQVHRRFPNMPVVLMSAYAGAQDVADAFEYGAYGCLPKPVRVEALLAGIRRLEAQLA